MAILIVAPGLHLPEALHDVRQPLLELRVAVLRGQLTRHLAVDDVSTTLYRHPTALEVFSAAVLLLILALSVCAYRYDCY